MANLYSHNEEQNQKGFEPTASSVEIAAQASTAAKIFLYIIMSIPLFLGWIWYFKRKNSLNRMQNDINNSASSIDVQLQKRNDTLVKLVQQVKSYKIHEAEVFENVTKMRSLAAGGRGIENSAEIENLNQSVFGRLMAISESYPELKASSLYTELMDETTYIEREIAAARRNYNAQANTFNKELFTIPTKIVAANMGLSTVRLFQASSKARKDVDMQELGL
ncbi:LemA family protein [Mycoplasma sp. 2704]|uniref:LemA family protein n=1 Tax=unclassified Mycoplasma TaxID=2683645 RepID=UPI002B1D172A|nr:MULTISPECIES: LemA family protein [unclassified Mycoplasma]MEA4134222.1 LemA family protein [Mycoplasma sp. 2704]MEA4333552.1 LemA family protein [Mycoplasma sp. 1232]